MLNQLKQHFKDIFAIQKNEVAVSSMILCGLAAGVQLFVGYFNNHLNLAIYGALLGYLLTINEFQGRLLHRLGVLTASYIMFIICFALGMWLSTFPNLFLLALICIAYWIGLFGVDGNELEQRLILGSCLFVIAARGVAISWDHAHILFFYSLFSYTFIAVALCIHFLLRPKSKSFFTQTSPFYIFKMSSPFERHLHAISFVLMVLIACFVATTYHLHRGYWVIVTTLLIMRPDRRMTLHRIWQRLIGTTIGVITSLLLIYILPSNPLIACFIVMICSGLVPWGLKKNYMFVSFFISIVVLMLLSMVSHSKGNDSTVALLRFQMTAIGCALGTFGVGLSYSLSRLFKHKLTYNKGDPV